MNNTKNKKSDSGRPQAPRFEDVSQITRLLNQLDKRDLTLSPARRKRKWLVILITLFVFFLLSFLLPFPRLAYESIGSRDLFFAVDSGVSQNPTKLQSPGFEMPVDSFENLLKRHIDASVPETK